MLNQGVSEAIASLTPTRAAEGLTIGQCSTPKVDRRLTATSSLGKSTDQIFPICKVNRSTRARWKGTQRRIGLTGGIATGKSSVGRHLEALGFPVLDADAFARDALGPGSDASKAVLDRFGASVQHDPISRETDNTPRINRAALGHIVFHNPLERQWLEQLIHPIVSARFSQELQQLHERAAVVLVIPLLFEARLTHLCSEIWVVACTPEQQRQRLQARDHLSDADANARIQAQWPLTKKISLADQVIDNSGQPDQWKAQLQQITQTTACKGV